MCVCYRRCFLPQPLAAGGGDVVVLVLRCWWMRWLGSRSTVGNTEGISVSQGEFSTSVWHHRTCGNHHSLTAQPTQHWEAVKNHSSLCETAKLKRKTVQFNDLINFCANKTKLPLAEYFQANSCFSISVLILPRRFEPVDAAGVWLSSTTLNIPVKNKPARVFHRRSPVVFFGVCFCWCVKFVLPTPAPTGIHSLL